MGLIRLRAIKVNMKPSGSEQTIVTAKTLRVITIPCSIGRVIFDK
jgi:hypothetical protein